MTYMAMPQQTPAPGVMKVTILVDPSLVIITIHLVCLDHAPEQKEDFLKNTSVLHFLPPKLPPLGVGVGGVFLSLTNRCYKPNLVKKSPVVLEKKMFMHNGRRTPTHSNRSLSYSGDLKKKRQTDNNITVVSMGIKYVKC